MTSQANANQIIRQYVNEHRSLVTDDYNLSKALIQQEKIRWENDGVVPYTPIPYCIEKPRYDALSKDAELVLKSLNRIVHLYASDNRIKTFFNHLKKFDAFLSLPVFSDPMITIARFDLLETTTGEFKVVEPNTCCPGGTIWTSKFHSILQQTNIYHYLSNNIREYPVEMQDGDTIFKYLISEYEEHFEQQNNYHLVIADTTSAPMETELYELRDAARERGIESEKAHIQDLIFNDGAVFLNNRKVDILYQFLDVLFTDDMAQVAANFEEIRGYMEGLQKKAFLAINPFPPIFISEDKSILALLMEESFASYFSDEEIRAIKALVPDTYRLRDTAVVFEDEKTNLIALLKAKKDDFIIKAQMESMGRDILIGKDASIEEWARKIDGCTDGLYVAQRFIEETPIPVMHPDQLDHWQNMYYTLELYMLGGKVKGMSNKLAPSFVTNVARGGVVQDVIIYEP